MHDVKQEALRMKEALLRGDFRLLRDVLLSSWESKKPAWLAKSSTKK